MIGGIYMDYNKEVLDLFKDTKGKYRIVNHYVMDHTYNLSSTDKRLMDVIHNTNNLSYMVKEEDTLNVLPDGKTDNIILSKKRTLEAAKEYKGKRVAILNFANNHSIGGAPWSAGAQEESLCRISTLYRSQEKFKDEFYLRHTTLFKKGMMNEMGNDDLIYLPKVCVFKTDESLPLLMNEEDWYYVDVITSAAPNLTFAYDLDEYRKIIYKRIEKVLQVAKKEKIEILILGAYGCGAFHNPPEVVASIFKMLLKQYHFDGVEFAIYCSSYDKFCNYEIFKNILGRKEEEL